MYVNTKGKETVHITMNIILLNIKKKIIVSTVIEIFIKSHFEINI